MRIAVGLGSNLGNRLLRLRSSVELLVGGGLRLIERSDVFETPPWGVTDQPRFLNACALFETPETPRETLQRLKEVERRLGRIERERYGPREVDCDLLFADDLRIDEPDLVVPHPRMAERGFVLIPLAQVAPDWRHPSTGRTVREMAEALPPQGFLRIVRLTP
jgi:2-amino-4-hydroxy-6-hydroxymethyldihydropteridine diphosphokinase